MASWGARFTALWRGKKPAPPRGPKSKTAESKRASTRDGSKGSRAKLIDTALTLHRDQGAPLRAALNKSVKQLEDRRTLRDPEVLARLLALAQARRAMQRLFAGDLRRYLVLAGLRQWTGKEPGAAGEGSGSDKKHGRPRNTVARR